MPFLGRGKNKVNVDYGIVDIYKYYKKNSKKPLDKKTFTNVWKDYATDAIDYIIHNNYELALVGQMGTISIRKSRTKPTLNEDGSLNKKKLCPNWAACWNLWQREYPDKSIEEIKSIPDKPIVYHTDKYKYSWKWDKRTCVVKNQGAYSFKIARWAADKLSSAIKDDDVDIDFYEFKT